MSVQKCGLIAVTECKRRRYLRLFFTSNIFGVSGRIGVHRGPGFEGQIHAKPVGFVSAARGRKINAVLAVFIRGMDKGAARGAGFLEYFRVWRDLIR